MKKKVLYLILGCLSQTLVSQDMLWEQFYGGSNNDLAHHLLFTNDGGFVTIGYTESFGNGIWGKPDMWLCKFDESGQMLWDKTIGQPDSLDKAYFGIEVQDGYLLIGERMEDITYGHGMGGVIIKTDFEGNEIWSKKYKGDDKDMLRHIQLVPGAGYIACGATRSNGAGFIDGWAVKLDEDCNIEWQSNFGGDDYEVFKQIYPTLDGGYLAGGFSNSEGFGSYDTWFVKMDYLGNLEWEKRIGNEYSNRLNYFSPTSDGNYIATGRSVQESQESDELFALKINPDCDIIWEQFYQATVEGEGYYIEEVSPGGFIIGGADANSIGGPWQTDGWVLRIGETGDLLWDYFIHGNASDLFYVARQNYDGDIIAAGGNMSNGAGMNDLWLTKLSDSTYITSINNNSISVTDIKAEISPNPFSIMTKVTVTCRSWDKVSELFIYNSYGQLINIISGKMTSEGSYEFYWYGENIHKTKENAGIYFARIKVGEITETERILKISP